MRERSYREINDRMGLYIRQIRTHEKITQKQLCSGLCSRAMLSKIESGHREAEKLLTDTLLQRMGKPVERFDRILGREEFERWRLRRRISALLRRGETGDVGEWIERLSRSGDILERQFAMAAELNRRALEGAAAEELLALAEAALGLTMPEYGANAPDDFLFSQLEGCLILALLELREQTGSAEQAEKGYRSLLGQLETPRYERRERICLSPYVACHVVEADWRRGRLEQALALCRRTLAELREEKRLFAFDRLLEWEQRLLAAMGSPDRPAERLPEQLRLLQGCIPARPRLAVPYEERGNVFCLNDVLRTRRLLVGITQEDMAEGICDVSTISAIENRRHSPQNHNRRALLEKVRMSGERYDYEIISGSFDDYLLLSRINRAILTRRMDEANRLLSRLRRSIDPLPANEQYLLFAQADIRRARPEGHPEHISDEEYIKILAGALRLTLPLEIDGTGPWPVGVLSVNELLLLTSYASVCKRMGRKKQCLRLLNYLTRCMEETRMDTVFCGDLYARIYQKLSSVLGDLGRYEESDLIAWEGIRLTLECQDSSLLPFYFYNIAWNREQRQSGRLPEGKEEAVSLFRLACAAALVSGDQVSGAHIRSHCIEIYGVDPLDSEAETAYQRRLTFAQSSSAQV